MPHRIIGVTGFRCAGKATVAEYLAQRTGYRKFDISDDIVWPLARQRGITDLEDTLVLVRNELTDDYMNGRTTEAIDAAPSGIVVSSLRMLAGYEFLKQRYGEEFVLMYLHAHQEVRFQRSLLRAREGDKKTLGDFSEYEWREIQQYKTDELINRASVVVVNSGTPEVLFRQLDAHLACGNL